jgi:hypothetical protein
MFFFVNSNARDTLLKAKELFDAIMFENIKLFQLNGRLIVIVLTFVSEYESGDHVTPNDIVDIFELYETLNPIGIPWDIVSIPDRTYQLGNLYRDGVSTLMKTCYAFAKHRRASNSSGSWWNPIISLFSTRGHEKPDLMCYRPKLRSHFNWGIILRGDVKFSFE